jgi:hypothetical protein
LPLSRLRNILIGALALAAFAAACASPARPELADEVSTATATETQTPTEAPSEVPTGAVQIAPLTGLPLEDPSAATRPAVMVKVDNSETARPQLSFTTADQVVELLVEGITRLAAVYHSTIPDVAGPTRSGRSSDPDIASNYNRPLYAWSGGNPTVRGEIRAAEEAGKLIDAGFDRTPESYFREDTRPAPHNLMVSVPDLYALAPADAQPPNQIFAYRASGDPSSLGFEVEGITITYTGGLIVDYVWDEQAGGWARFQDRSAHRDVNGVQALPPNVVVMFTEYVTSAADPISPQALTVGAGEAWVLTDGRLIQGQWVRGSDLESWVVVDDAGTSVPITPGQTWIALPKSGEAQVISEAEAAALLEIRDTEDLSSFSPADQAPAAGE